VLWGKIRFDRRGLEKRFLLIRARLINNLSRSLFSINSLQFPSFYTHLISIDQKVKQTQRWARVFWSAPCFKLLQQRSANKKRKNFCVCVCARARARERLSLARAADLLSPSIRSRAFRQTKNTSVGRSPPPQRNGVVLMQGRSLSRPMFLHTGGPRDQKCVCVLTWGLRRRCAGSWSRWSWRRSSRRRWKDRRCLENAKKRERVEKRLNETAAEWHFVTVMQFSHCQLLGIISLKVCNLLLLLKLKKSSVKSTAATIFKLCEF
jgi:hypothetical protein